MTKPYSYKRNDMSLNTLKREDFLYQPYYCEENIWHLCQHKLLRDSYVIFILSRGEAFPMLNQQAASNPKLPVFWDYHVILLVMAKQNLIVDFDTTLEFVNDMDFYFQHSFLHNQLLDPGQIPMFRIIPSKDYITLFSSDRSHMKTASGWLASPPQWPLIDNSGYNLFQCIDINNKSIGKILSYDEILNHFSVRK